MNRTNAPISLADLSAAGVRLRPYEAVTLVRELMLQVVRGEIAGVPSAHVIRLSASGTLSIEGPVGAGDRSIVRAAQLLDSLLPPSDQGNQFKVPGGLRLVLGRALSSLDLPSFPSLESFADALARFAATDASAVVATLVYTWSECIASHTANDVTATVAPTLPSNVEPFVVPKPIDFRGPLAAGVTISDIRRARRATGAPLSQVAARSQVPIGLLRQLEWGYLANWPSGPYGRTLLAQYARAAGLDEQLVLSAVVPVLEESESGALPVRSAPILIRDERGPDGSRPVVEIEELPLAPVAAVLPLRRPVTAQVVERRRGAGTRVLAALAIPALLAIALLPGWWAHSTMKMNNAPGATSAESTILSKPAVEAPPLTAPATPTATTPAPSRAAKENQPVGALGTETPRPRADVPRPADEVRPAYRLAVDGFSPSFASVGTAVFYRAEDEDGRAALARTDDADGRGAVLRITRIVDDNARNFHVRPSPDGERIAFDSDRDGVRGVYVADADGRNVHRVSGEGFAAVPSWSPDGSKLAFVRADASQPDVWNLWTLDLASSELKQITRHQYGQPWGGSWFPDGRHLAYAHDEQLILRDLVSGEQRVFASPRKGRLLRTPAVSPDGRHIAFQVYRDGTWLLDLPDGAMRKVLEDPTAEEYVWSPDGRQLAYHSRRADAWGVWVMAPRTTSRLPELR